MTAQTQAYETELDAFGVLLASGPAGAPACAQLLRVWFELSRAQGQTSSQSFTQFCSALEQDDRSALPELARALPAELVGYVIGLALGKTSHIAVDDRALATHYAALRMHPLLTGVPLEVVAQKKKRARLAVVGVAVLFIALVAAWKFSPRAPVWRVVYYGDDSLVHPVSSAVLPDVGGEWGMAPAHRAQPLDGFSDRWETCLNVTEPMEPYFQLASDDGGKLVIDRQTIVDMWKDQPFTEMSARHRMQPGWHYVRVDHYDRAGAAGLRLKWSRTADTRDAYESIPRNLLRLPKSSGQPCAE